MYVPAGFGGAELGDIEIVARGDELHLFHLVLPNHDRVAHLSSRDGLAWRRLPDAVRTGPPGRFDDDMIWTMGVVQHGGAYHMLYTALSVAERGVVQRLGHAQSTDLVHWKQDEAPAGEADDPRLETDRMHAPWVSFRDPKSVVVDERIVTAVCARVAEGPARRRGSVAFYESDDPRKLGTLSSVFTPWRAYDLECPQVFGVDDRWFLLASVIDDRTQRYWIGNGPQGPWRTPDVDRLLPFGNYAARAFTWRGRPCVLAWYRDASGHGALLSPMELEVAGDGTLVPGRWSAWDDRRGEARTLGAPKPTWVPGEASQVLTSKSGANLWTWPDPGSCFELELSAEVDAPRFGIALGIDDNGGALQLLFDRGDGFVRVVDERCAPDERARPWFSRTPIQEHPCRPGPRFSLRLRRWGDAIEVDVDGRIVVAALAPTRRGMLGLVVESGRAEIESARIYRIDPPITT